MAKIENNNTSTKKINTKAKVATKTNAKADTKVATKVDTKTTMKVDVKTTTKVDTKTKVDAKTNSNTNTKTDTNAESSSSMNSSSLKKSFDKSTIKNLSDGVQKDVKQLILGLVAGLIILSLIIAQLSTKSDDKSLMDEMVLNIILGTSLGFVLARGAYGFAGAFRKPIAVKDYSLSKSVAIFLAITTVLVAMVAMIEESQNLIKGDYIGIIEENGISTTMSFMFIIGGLLFGIGMIMAGGCASGTLQDIGVGAAGAMLALFGWMFGVFVGLIFKAPMTDSWMGADVNLNLFKELGVFSGLLVNLMIIGLIYVLLIYLENKFGNQEANKTALDIEQENEKEYIENKVSFVSNKRANRMYYNVFQKKWTLLTTAILLSIVGIFSLVDKGGWGISSTYGYWGAWILDGFGADVTAISLTGDMSQSIVQGGLNETVFNDGFWNHGGSMYNISIILGSTMAIALSGKFVLDYKMKVRNVVIFVLGGFLMGFGTRLSGGCNIGALVDPIVTGEISGYAYGILLTAGAWIGLKFMAGAKAL